MAEHDALVHLAFVVTEARPRAEVDAINVGGSANVFTAATQAGVTRIVYSSSIAAYGVVPGHPSRSRRTRRASTSLALRTRPPKFEVEAWLDRFEALQPNVAVARLRPAILLGHDMDHALGYGLRKGASSIWATRRCPSCGTRTSRTAVALALLAGARGAFNVAADDLLSAHELARAAGFALYACRTRLRERPPP